MNVLKDYCVEHTKQISLLVVVVLSHSLCLLNNYVSIFDLLVSNKVPDPKYDHSLQRVLFKRISLGVVEQMNVVVIQTVEQRLFGFQGSR